MRTILSVISTSLLLSAAAAAQEPEKPVSVKAFIRPVEPVEVREVQQLRAAEQDLQAAEELIRLRDTHNTFLKYAGANDPHREVIQKLKTTANEACAKCHVGGVSVKKEDGLGLTLVPADETLRSQLKLGRAGLVVTAVEKGSTGEAGGLKEKDIVVAVGGKPVEKPDDLFVYVRKPGPEAKPADPTAPQPVKPLAMRIVRAGQLQDIRLPAPEPAVLLVGRLTAAGEADKTPSYWIGVSIDEADDTLRSHLKLPEGVGLVVTDVIKDTPAEKAGIRKDDVLMSLDHTVLKAAEDMVKIVQASKGEKSLTLNLRRAGDTYSFAVRPEKRKEPQAIAARFHTVPVDDAHRQAWVAQVLPFIEGQNSNDRPIALSTIQGPDGQLIVTGQPMQGQALGVYRWLAAQPPADTVARAALQMTLTKDLEVQLKKAVDEVAKRTAAPQETLLRIDTQLKALEAQLGEVKRSVEDLKGAIKKEK